MAPGLGSITFVGFNATGFTPDDTDNLAFVVLEPIAAGTVIHFTDNEWNGAAFNTGESTWSWTAASDIVAGTVVTMDGLRAGQTVTSNLGTIAYSVEGGRDIAVANETIYAFVGGAAAPTFITAVGNNSFSSNNGLLNNTGLVEGQTAISLQSAHPGADIATYAGIRAAVSFDALLPMINNPANWIAQSGNTAENDGTAPDVPFATEPFVGEPNFQTISFAPSTLTISQTEGDSGETVFTFTVERSGGSAGTIDFSGMIEVAGTIRADDFTGPLSFTGTIEDGQTSGTVTVRVAGDLTFEPDETFTLTLQSVSNDSVGTVVGEEAVATGTIVNDDVAPVEIAFVGMSARGGDNLAFLAVSDIAEGAVIHFTNGEWMGSAFEMNGVVAGAGAWSWTADADIAAGTVITMDDLNTGSATSNLGTVTLISANPPEFRDNSFEYVYAYLGEHETPTSFLSAISHTPNFTSNGATLAGTGLAVGVNAITLGVASLDDIDIAYYNGPRTGQTSFESYLPSIYDPANWSKQENRFDSATDGIFPDAPFPALPFSTDPTVQVVEFADGSLSVTQSEGTGAGVTFTFAVERTNGTEGDLTFTLRVPVAPYSDSANETDFGGALPLITGTIPDGQSSTTVTVTVTGDTFFELDERFHLVLESASNPDASSVVIGNDYAVIGTIGNDDVQPTRVLAGEEHSATIRLTEDAHFVIEEGGITRDITWRGDANIVIDNGGETGSITTPGGSGGSVVINNLATGVIRGIVSAEDAGQTDYTLNNAGRIELFGDRMDLRDPADDGATVVVNNLAGGVIVQMDGQEDIMRPGLNTVVNNHGSITHVAGIVGGSSDGLDFQGDPGVVNNYDGGLIEASRHAVTGDAPVALFNEGTMIGRNGSAINIDSNGTEAERVFITNRGHMEGRSANLADSDGDAVDIDGLLTLENYGFIGGMGHNGYHDGEPNVSEAVAIGGGTITNHAGGEIYGYGRAIQVDNSSNSNALGTTTIVNHGLIHGDGNVPTAVTPEEVAQFAERIRGGEAINLLGNYGDVVTNTGQIVGGVKMGGGDDVIVNKGVMTATGGSAANLGDGDDTFEVHAGSTVTGLLDGGEGDDTLKLIGPGVGTLGANANFENLDIQSGMWTLQSDAYDQVDVATGAMVTSQLTLADQGEMTVVAGGTVLVTNGSDAAVAEGAASIENAGLIQALGMNGMTPAKAILTNGGEIHNKAGGIILGQGVAIATGAAVVAGVDIVNEGMIQSLSGQAIALSGDQDDSVANKGMINGSVDLGAGDDTLAIHTGSSIAGAVDGGEGTDTVKLVGTAPATIGSFNSASVSSFEKLVVAEGVWSVADSTPYSDIRVEDGATLLSRMTLNDGDKLTIEQGGTLDLVVTSNIPTITIQGPANGVTIDNSGLITSQIASRTIQATFANGEPYETTIWNRETGVITNATDGTVFQIEGGQPVEGAPASGPFTLNNAGQILGGDGGYVIAAHNFRGEFILNNYATGLIESGPGGEAYRGGGTINNWGIMRSGMDENDPNSYEGDGINFRSRADIVVNNYGSGLIEGGHHAVTGETGGRILNDVGGVMIGHNGSAVNIDNNGSEAEKVFVTNRGLMEGRSAEIDDSDGDAIDVDGLVQVLNYGRIAGLGAEGYHNGEPNVSEGIAIGGGTIVNNSTGEIYGYGRAIQVDNSSNSNALGVTTIVNDGLIQGDGHGPEGVDPEDAAEFDLRGNEAINLIGDYEDWVINNSAGRIVGGVSMGGGRDTLNNSGSIVATGGSAIDMGAGDDQLNLYVGSTVEGAILLGDGDDVANSTSAAVYTIYGGDGNDSIAMYYTIFGGDDVLYGEAGNDHISGGLGEDRIDGGLDNDTLYGDDGDDLIEGGTGDDTIDGGNDDDVIFGDAGNDTLMGGLGNDVVKGGADNDTFVVQSSGDGRDSYDGGEGIDTLDYTVLSTAVNLTLKNGVTTFQTDTIENIENVVGGSANDKLTGNSLDNVLTGNAGNDTLKGAAGNDILDGGEGDDTLDGGADNDQLSGGLNDDTLKGAAGNDTLDGGEGDDNLDGGAGNDTLLGGLGDDVLKGGAGDDVIEGGAGADMLTGGAGHDQFLFDSLSDGIDTITDFKVAGASEDQLVLSGAMFTNFTGDDAFDLIGSGFLRALSSGGETEIQIDLDGGGDDFATLASLTGNFSNGTIADHLAVHWELIA